MVRTGAAPFKASAVSVPFAFSAATAPAAPASSGTEAAMGTEARKFRRLIRSTSLGFISYSFLADRRWER